MKSSSELPVNYKEVLRIDLQEDKKLMLLVNVIAFLIVAAMSAAGYGICRVLRITLSDIMVSIPQLLVIVLGIVVYLVLHELVHGICFKKFGESKPRYGFTGMYAFASSDDYFGKKYYLISALAPIVVWGIVLMVLQLIVPLRWFLVVYLIQVINISGGAGDIYVALKLLRMPNDILVRDWGTDMSVYAPEKLNET